MILGNEPFQLLFRVDRPRLLSDSLIITNRNKKLLQKNLKISFTKNGSMADFVIYYENAASNQSYKRLQDVRIRDLKLATGSEKEDEEMIELDNRQSQIINSLCEDREEVLIQSALEGSTGHVWMPIMNKPSYCLVQQGDFSYLIGIPPKAAKSLELRETLIDYCSHGFIIPGDELWDNWMEENFSGEYRLISRYATKKECENFDQNQLKDYIKNIPDGIKIKKISEKLYQQALKEEWSRDFCSNFSSAEDFLQNGLGYVAMDGKQIVAGCSAYGRGHDRMSIQVETREDYRKQGLALACSASFILDCLERGIYPEWDAANLQSVGLAEKLGYVFDKEYQVYEFLEHAIELID